MKMTAGRRALDKMYKRRDRYEIPEWQREEVWNQERKRLLIDSILRGWKLPKFYFVRVDDESFEVVDGQQRLTAIWEFFSNELALGEESVGEFGGPYYKDLHQNISDDFDDFEIEFDEIEDANEEELKDFFQRLQQGLPLTSSEKLNSVHSKLRDYCRSLCKHSFFKNSISLGDTRFAHFDIVSKATVVEIEGIDCGLRFDDIKTVFEDQKTFSGSSAVAKRLKSALDFLSTGFASKEKALKNRTVIQSLITLACRIVETKKSKGLEGEVAKFILSFLQELSRQVELGQDATDYDYLRFQRSINANVKAGARIRHEILLRRALMSSATLADAFDPSIYVASGITGRVKELGESIATAITRINAGYASANGEDLFKATNKTTTALRSIGKPIKNMNGYQSLIDHLYFVFRESTGQRLQGRLPLSFEDVNALRTDLQHDVDHGSKGKVKKKRKSIGSVFEKYSGIKAPELLDPIRFSLVQANLLSAIDRDLNNLSIH